MKLLEGKRFVIFGVANERSIAWGIAQALHQHGAELAFSYVNESIEKRLRPLAESLGAKFIGRCDVLSDQDIDSFYNQLSEVWGTFDGLVHSVAFANKDDLNTDFVNTSREGFRLALDVSAYSLIAVSKRAVNFMKEKGGSILTMSYLGSERVVPNYNVMGVAKAALEASVRYLAADLGQYNIRVNALSPGPIKTLAASGIPNFRELIRHFESAAPMHRSVTPEDVGNTSVAFLGPLTSGITGEVVYLDCGFSIMGMAAVAAEGS